MYPQVSLHVQTFQHSIEHRSMAVVTAGMHHAIVLRRPLHARHLFYRHSVYIGTQDNTSLVVATTPLNTSQHSCPSNRAMLNTQSIQLLGDKGCCLPLLECKFGMRVQMTTKIYRIHNLMFYFFTTLRGRQRAATFARLWIYLGVVPQQPPMILSTPARHICSISLEK